MDDETRNIVALIASFFCPGLGQAVKGNFGRAAIFFFGFAGLLVMALVLTIVVIGVLLYPVVFGVWLYGMYDAFKMEPVKKK